MNHDHPHRHDWHDPWDWTDTMMWLTVFACAVIAALVLYWLTPNMIGEELPLPDASPAPVAAEHQQQAKLWSRENLVAFSANVGLRIADSALTCRNDSLPGAYERTLPTRHCGPATAWIMSGVPLQIGAVWLLQRAHHNKLARIAAWGFPAASVEAVTYSATH